MAATLDVINCPKGPATEQLNTARRFIFRFTKERNFWTIGAFFSVKDRVPVIYISNLLSSKTVAKEITMKKKETDTCANHFNCVLLNLMFMTVLLQHRKSHHPWVTLFLYKFNWYVHCNTLSHSSLTHSLPPLTRPLLSHWPNRSSLSWRAFMVQPPSFACYNSNSSDGGLN